jgi:hypothetical protein
MASTAGLNEATLATMTQAQSSTAAAVHFTLRVLAKEPPGSSGEPSDFTKTMAQPAWPMFVVLL